MKKLLSAILICFLIINGLQAFGLSEEKVDLKYNLVESVFFSDPIIKENGQNLILEVENTNSYTNEPGYPILPIYSKTYNFPIGTKIDDVEVQFSDSKEIIIDNEIVSSPIPFTFKDGKKILYSSTEINS